MKYFIGLDSHSTTSTFAIVDQNGQCILRSIVKTCTTEKPQIVEIPSRRTNSIETSYIAYLLV